VSATAKQIETLRWLIERGWTEKIDSVALWTKYEDEKEPGLSSHPLRVVAWKRISGATFQRMKRAGLVEYHSATYSSYAYSGHRIYYQITEAGFAAAGVPQPIAKEGG
jgi:hypothetical protein